MALPAGTRLGPYEILSPLGAGGMGEVYRARDTRLGRDVAVKVLPSDFAHDVERLVRFEREARVVAALSHPNILALYDVGEVNDIHYVVTELLEGETLRERLAMGALPLHSAVEIGVEIAHGLAAAHAREIVHRDLKPANIFVTSDGVVKVLDFGLAKLARPEAAVTPNGTTLSREPRTESGTVLGTMGYTSPEQLRGEAADERSDIFSFGCVLYEMLSGNSPFLRLTGVETITAIMSEDPEPLHGTGRATAPALKEIVKRCLEKRADDRFSSAHDIALALRAFSEPGVGVEAVAGAVAVTAEKQRPRAAIAAVGLRRWFVGAVAAAVILVFAAITYHRHVTRKLLELASPVPAVSSFKARRAVAVLGFKNLSGRPETAWLSIALSEMLSVELGAGERLRTIPGENVARTKIELRIPDVDSLAKDTLGRIRTNLGADLVALGSYFAMGKDGGGKVRLDLRLQDAAVGDNVVLVTDSGTEAELPDLVARAGALVREKLGLSGITEAEASGVKASLPSKPELTKLYSEGLAKLRVFDDVAARELLEKAVAVEPNYPLAHSALAEVWSNLGDFPRASNEAKKAYDLSAGLSREERLLVEGRHRTMAGEKERAVEIYQTLWSFFPDNLEYGLKLAAAQASFGKGKDALAAIEAMRKLPPPESDDPRIDLAESRAADSVSDLNRALAAATRAVERAEKQGAGLLVAKARLTEAWSLSTLGQNGKATRSREEAERIYTAEGDQPGLAVALRDVGWAMSDRGDLPGARRMFEESLAVSRKMGDKQSAAWKLGDLAGVLERQGDQAGSRKMYEESLALFRETGDTGGVSMRLVNIGSLLKSQGNVAGAKTRVGEALSAARKVENRSLRAWRLGNTGFLLQQLGSPAEAKAVFEESLAIFQLINDRSGVAAMLRSVAFTLRNQGDIDGARKKYEESLAVYREMGAKWGVAMCLDNISDLAGSRGDLAEAKRLGEEALLIYREMGNRRFEANAFNRVAIVLFDQGDLSGAQKSFEQSLSLFRQLGDISQVGVLLENTAELIFNQGKVIEAQARFEEAIKILRGTGDKANLSDALSGYGLVLAATGDLPGAVKSQEESLALCRERNDRMYESQALFRWGQVLFARGDVSGARKKHEESHTIRKELHAKAREAESWTALAALSIEEGRASEGEALARQAAGEFAAEKRADDEAVALSLLARALLRQARAGDARSSVDKARTLCAKTQRLEVRQLTDLETARIVAAAGRTVEARKSLEALLADSARAGHVTLQFEARLELAEIEAQTGGPAARGHVETLQKDAVSKGYGRIAQKVTEVLQLMKMRS